jgi:hypothetical protein
MKKFITIPTAPYSNVSGQHEDIHNNANCPLTVMYQDSMKIFITIPTLVSMVP